MEILVFGLIAALCVATWLLVKLVANLETRS
jgi:hypothetical protein